MDVFNLNRFIIAQDNCYNDVITELRAGKKRTHWIWYIFPQLKGLGYSYNSEYYGLDGIEEAQEYLSNPILGGRLVECCEILLSLKENDITRMMHYPDDIKLKSCMELFSEITSHPFNDVLKKFFY